MGEKRNLKDKYPELTNELKNAESWRASIEERWGNYWLKKNGSTT